MNKKIKQNKNKKVKRERNISRKTKTLFTKRKSEENLYGQKYHSTLNSQFKKPVNGELREGRGCLKIR